MEVIHILRPEDKGQSVSYTAEKDYAGWQAALNGVTIAASCYLQDVPCEYMNPLSWLCNLSCIVPLFGDYLTV